MAMKAILKAELIKLPLEATTKEGVIAELIDLLGDNGEIIDKYMFSDAIYYREKLGITGMGAGVAIPHGQSKTVVNPAVAIGIAKSPIKWESYDEQPVDLIFMLAIPAGKDHANDHLQLLAQLARKLANPKLNQLIREVTNIEVIKELLS